MITSTHRDKRQQNSKPAQAVLDVLNPEFASHVCTRVCMHSATLQHTIPAQLHVQTLPDIDNNHPSYIKIRYYRHFRVKDSETHTSWNKTLVLLRISPLEVVAFQAT